MKRLLAILLSVSLVIPTINATGICEATVIADDVETEAESPEETAAPEPLVYDLGDVDVSGVIDASDALNVLKYAAKISTLEEVQLGVADVDKSGNVDATDALYILQYAAKIIVRFVFTPEENFQVLKTYVCENGVVNKSGNKEISIDYVALGESICVKEIESIQYVEKKDMFIYICEVDDPATKNTFRYYMELDAENTKLTVNWTKHYINKSLEVKATSKFFNSKYSLSGSYRGDLDTKNYSSEINASDLTKGEEKTWDVDLRLLYNAHVHAAIASFNEFLNRTVIMRLSDIYTSYVYSEEKFYEQVAPLLGIYPAIATSIKNVKNGLKNKGELDNGVYRSYCELDNMYASIGYAIEDDVLFIDGFKYFSDENLLVYVYIIPNIDRTFYIYAETYSVDINGELILQSAAEEVLSSVELGDEFECIYPEGGTVNNKLISDTMNEVLTMVSKRILRNEYSILLNKLGFVTFS